MSVEAGLTVHTWPWFHDAGEVSGWRRDWAMRSHHGDAGIGPGEGLHEHFGQVAVPVWDVAMGSGFGVAESSHALFQGIERGIDLSALLPSMKQGQG